MEGRDKLDHEEREREKGEGKRGEERKRNNV